jgi:biotin transport system substrate-specific component
MRMTLATTDFEPAPVLAEILGPESGTALKVKQVLLVVAGILAMWAAAKLRIPFGPVPVTMQTFVVLSVGAAYGQRLGLATMLGYLAVGALGFDVFTSSSAEVNGLTYMLGATGGYLAGFAVATAVMGVLARRGWDRSVVWMALAMLIGNAVIYAVGLPWFAWLFVEAKGLQWVLDWGILNFLAFDAVKLALAAVLFPVLWKAVGAARG